MDVFKLLCCCALLLVFSSSCLELKQESKNEIHSLSVLIDPEGVEVDKNKGYLVKEEDNENLYFKYTYEGKDSRAFLYQDSDRFVLIENADTITLITDAVVAYTIGEKEYKVYKLIESKGQIDGDYVHFLSIDYGLMLSKSLTWDKFIEIEVDNEPFKILKSIVYNDTEVMSLENKRNDIMPPPPPQ